MMRMSHEEQKNTFRVRLRKIDLKDYLVEAETLRDAYRKVCDDPEKSESVPSCGCFYEIESITTGVKNDRHNQSAGSVKILA